MSAPHPNASSMACWKRHAVEPAGLGYTVRRFEVENLLVLQPRTAGRWLIIDRTHPAPAARSGYRSVRDRPSPAPAHGAPAPADSGVRRTAGH
ncbi:hypothetical protein FB559_6970 [Actinoallomurus bryophytorum]|uniref:Uncharacterized protein n=1 Tax=Actinoallomurus bryophytorum TaxID=1490222 RepID=A0A543CVT4_9ACTN|nr:hypothetical protein FB559_6970 [Actinoallomurus bryophytorum]